MQNIYCKVGVSVFLLSAFAVQYTMYHTTYASLRGDWKQRTLINLSLLPYSLVSGTIVGLTWPGLLVGGSYFIIKKNL